MHGDHKVNKSNDLFSCGLNNNTVEKGRQKVTTTENSNKPLTNITNCDQWLKKKMGMRSHAGQKRSLNSRRRSVER